MQQLVPRISVLPLGCGALAGNPFVVDRDFLAKELGFQYVAENSLYGVGDRDFVVEFLMWATLAMTHISRMAEDLVIYSTAEFGFVTLSDAYRYVNYLLDQRGTAIDSSFVAPVRASCRKRKTRTLSNCSEESRDASLAT